MKTFDGNAIEVQVGTGATLFVTNFPPTADENFIREKFAKVSFAKFFERLITLLTYNSLVKLLMCVFHH